MTTANWFGEERMGMWRESANSTSTTTADHLAIGAPWRGGSVAVAIALMIVTSQLSWVATLAATIVCILAARGKASRLALALLGVLLAAGIPWIAAAALCGFLWVLLTAKRTASRWVPRRWTVPTVVGIVAIGAAAGGVAAGVSVLQYSDNPIQLDIVAPPQLALWIAVVALAAANAFGEEVLWRGILADELGDIGPAVAVLLQAISFGAAHWFGLPTGLWGAILAALFSCAMYWLSSRHGMLSSTVAHAITDVMIFAVLAPTVLLTGWYAAPGLQ
jgi:membrane protease YdiL (CAAX protease family)